jgi:hypothetical protein
MKWIKGWWMKLTSLIMSIFVLKNSTIEAILPESADFFKEPDTLESRYKPFFPYNMEGKLLGVTTSSATTFATTTTSNIA